MEGHWENTGPAALVVFGIPDQDRELNRAEIAIPRLGSLILKHDPNGRYAGLKDFPKSDRPPETPDEERPLNERGAAGARGPFAKGFYERGNVLGPAGGVPPEKRQQG